MKIVTSAQMVALEQAAQGHGVSTDTLMENAGLAVARCAREKLGGVAGVKVLVLVGPGNNGADGLVTARHLGRWGAEVTAYVVTRRPDPDPKMELALAYGVTRVRAEEDPDLSRLAQVLRGSRLVIDAVLGTGRSRPLAGRVRDILQRLADPADQPFRPLRLALDLPTGLDPDTGAVDPAGLAADLTVALGFPKAGLLRFPGAERVGELHVVDIGLPEGLPEEATVPLELLTPGWVGQRLPRRPLDSHKGTFGHALLVAGSRNYVGAAYLSAQAEVRSGAGLVTLASPRSVYPIAASKLTEAIHLPLPEDEAGRVSPEAAELVREGLERYSVLVVGCGLGWSAGTTEFLERLLLSGSLPDMPVLIDADGLNNLSRLPHWWQKLAGQLVLTPHPGEMATLARCSTGKVQEDRVACVRHWSASWEATLVLKGAHTAIARSGGLVRLAPFANPGLASGGTGDVLTGIIGGLLAQGMDPGEAACCAVYLHGQAAARVTEQWGNTGSVASDLLAVLPDTIRQLRS